MDKSYDSIAVSVFVVIFVDFDKYLPHSSLNLRRAGLSSRYCPSPLAFLFVNLGRVVARGKEYIWLEFLKVDIFSIFFSFFLAVQPVAETSLYLPLSLPESSQRFFLN